MDIQISSGPDSRSQHEWANKRYHHLKTGEGFTYHCVIRDIVTGDVLGDHMADRMTKEPVVNAIKVMLARTNWPKGVSFSDRGPVHVKSR